MYGIVNQAIHGLVLDNFGEQSWREIKMKAGIEEDYFLSDQSYDDSITYDLVGAASEVLNIPASSVLFAFGEYWVLQTGQKKYGDLMKGGGANFYDFIKNLPNFHSRIMLIYPKLSPPEFKVDEISDKILHLHYFSSREGLTDFVDGLLSGLSKMFGVESKIKLIASNHEIVWHDVFEIEIGN
jgi:hypothetical protein